MVPHTRLPATSDEAEPITGGHHCKACSFLKKRTKRLLILRQRTDPGHGRRGGSGGKVKVFWFFFSKKNCFLNTPAAEAAAGADNSPAGAAAGNPVAADWASSRRP
jgi:hypothetical protein